MDPVSALVFASVVTWLWAKNVSQDAAFAVRGKEPPSARRERERWEQRNKDRAAKGQRPEPRREARTFFGHAWADAWATAEERRARAAEKRRQERHEEWRRRDEADRIEDEAHDADRDHDRRRAEQQPMRCEQCGGEFPASELALVAVDGKPTWACPPCADAARSAYPKAPKTGTAPADADPGDRPSDAPEPRTDEEGGDGGTVLPFAPRTDPAGNPTPIPAAVEAQVSGETPNLQAAINYNDGMAGTCNEGVASTEQSIANCQDGGMTPGPALSEMAAGQEALSVAAGHFQAAADNLRQHLTLTEGYNANQDAGDKEFVTQD